MTLRQETPRFVHIPGKQQKFSFWGQALSGWNVLVFRRSCTAIFGCLSTLLIGQLGLRHHASKERFGLPAIPVIPNPSALQRYIFLPTITPPFAFRTVSGHFMHCIWRETESSTLTWRMWCCGDGITRGDLFAPKMGLKWSLTGNRYSPVLRGKANINWRATSPNPFKNVHYGEVHHARNWWAPEWRGEVDLKPNSHETTLNPILCYAPLLLGEHFYDLLWTYVMVRKFPFPRRIRWSGNNFKSSDIFKGTPHSSTHTARCAPDDDAIISWMLLAPLSGAVP